MLGLPYHIEEIARLCLAKDLFQGLPQPVPIRRVAFDTRKVSHGYETLFVALTTSRRDGHDFIPQALELGVQTFLVDRPLKQKGINYILVDDPLEALQLWAMHHRLRMSYPVMGITGSNGKTTVKEWLFTLMEWERPLIKSPMSYNSQLGVALSLLQLPQEAGLALIEAGISQMGEMERLQQMIQPQLGLLTHMGDAHQAGFPSFEEKLAQKCQLFEGVETLFASSEQPRVISYLRQRGFPLQTVGFDPGDNLRILRQEATDQGWVLQLAAKGISFEVALPLPGAAARENALLAILAARHLGMELPQIQERLPLLAPVEMRMEILTDHPQTTLINDSYNADADSVRHAFQVLKNIHTHPRKVVVLSDLLHVGHEGPALHQQLYEEAVAAVGTSGVITVGPVFASLGHPQAYPDTDALIEALRKWDFSGSVVLLKGARPFALERLIPLLNPRQHATQFEIDLDALAQNYHLLKSRLPEGTHTMCMVKAFSYGSGTWEIAQVLEEAGATYLAVAYAHEGLALRQARIRLPVMVMNPDVGSIPLLLDYELEPEVSNFRFLEAYLRAAHARGKAPYRMHLKLETGMGRLGFVEEDLPHLAAYLQRYPDILVVSVLSHLAAADEPAEAPFTIAQIARFQTMYGRLQAATGLQAFRHILNTAGILRFREYAFEMVRLGLGLYGISPVGDPGQGLEEIGRLTTRISQIRAYPPGTSIGYGRAQRTLRPSRIATLPIGYADGVPRNLGEGRLEVLIRQQRAPTFGRICMDMLMVDVSDIPGAQPGDEVVIFGRQGAAQQSVTDLALAAGTIPYEILVRISPRVKRVYARGH